MPKFLNKYECPRCDHAWEDVWSSMVDDDCPQCGKRHISPHESIQTSDVSNEEDDDA